MNNKTWIETHSFLFGIIIMFMCMIGLIIFLVIYKHFYGVLLNE